MKFRDTALAKTANLFFPADIYCAACGNLIDHTRPYAFCDRCVREIEWHTDDVRTCRVCGKALAPHRTGGVCGDCREWGRSFDHGISCCTYSGRTRDLVRAMKYKDAAWIANGIAEAMYDRWMQMGDAAGSPCEEIAAHIHPAPLAGNPRDAALPISTPASATERHAATMPIVIPVPMTEAKKRARGYDQADLIARKLARHIGAPFEGDVLRRKRDTAVMSELGIFERRANMADAFEIDDYARKLIESGERTLGDVLLVDDVFTTGSTADACATVLKDAGAGKVTLFTFASGADMGPAPVDSDESESAGLSGDESPNPDASENTSPSDASKKRVKKGSLTG